MSLSSHIQVQLLAERWKFSQRQYLLINKIRACSLHRSQPDLTVETFLQAVAAEVSALLKLDACYFSPLNFRQKPKIDLSLVTDYSWVINGVHLPKSLEGQAQTTNWMKQRQLSSHSDFPSYILIPVLQQGKRIGVMVCLSCQPRYWLAGEISLLHVASEEIENILAIVFQSRSLHRYRQLAKREQLINQITRQTRSSLDLKTILTGAISQLGQALAADRCIVHLVEDPTEINPDITVSEVGSQTTFRRKHLYEYCQSPFSATLDDFDTHGPITEWIIEHQQAVVIDDVTQDERIGAENPEYQQAQICSSLVIPVQTTDKLYAILYVNQCAYFRHWSADDQHLVQMVADQLAIAIQQAHLYAQMRQQALQSQAQAQQLAKTLKELRLTQAQLIQNEKMSSLDQLVAGMAHELNNPVSFIHGNLPYLETYFTNLLQIIHAYQQHDAQSAPLLDKLIQELDFDFLQHDVPNILNSMKAGTTRIQEIIQVLQNFARLNEAPLKAIDPRVALTNVLSILNTQIPPHIQINCDYEEVAEIECYPKQLNQALLSVITNAIEALQRSPKAEKRLTIRLRKVAATAQKSAGIEVAITDNGEGIPPEIQSRIFDPFFTTKEIGQGRGLGLTATYQIIVDQHHGEIRVQSELNQGTEFLLYLPLYLPTLEIPRQISQPLAAISSRRQ